MVNQNSLIGFYLSQTLIHKGFSIKEWNGNKKIDNNPLIFFLFNGGENICQFSLSTIENFLKEHNFKRNPIFIVTNHTAINYFSRIDHLGAIVEIQVDPKFNDDVINTYDKVGNVLQREKLKYIETVMNATGEKIAKYVNHLPSEDEYIIEKVVIEEKKPTIGVVGLGYVGLPVAVGLAKKYNVIGFDINQEKIDFLKKNIDITGELSHKELEGTAIEFTILERKLEQCNYIIIVVPTPITLEKKPDLTYLKNATKIVGRNLSPGTIVIYESTVYPGTTDDICIPILETHSQLKAGEDFHVGYSPERINPGDREHTFEKNSKVVSGQNDFALKKIYQLYDHVLEAEVYKAPSIKVAEAAKIVENTQRDINIALMNELAIVFEHLNIDTSEVLKAARTKWNFLPFTPGLVGGHCIGVDPYYLIYQSILHGYEPKFISSARYINDQMPDYIVESLLKLLIKHQFNLKDLKVTVLGITFKENISDIRNSKTLEIVERLQDLGLSVQVCDPMLSPQAVQNKKLDLREFNQLNKAQVVIFSVPHQKFAYTDKNFFHQLLDHNQGIVMDIKGVIPNNVLHQKITHWKL